jgi:hypothetical protein
MSHPVNFDVLAENMRTPNGMATNVKFSSRMVKDEFTPFTRAEYTMNFFVALFPTGISMEMK